MVEITKRKILKIFIIATALVALVVIVFIGYVLIFNRPKTVTLQTANGSITETQVAGLQFTSQTWRGQVRVTPDKKISFTSAQDKPEYADWDQVTLLGGSRLDYVEVAYAHNGLTVWGDDVQITRSAIHDSLWSCVDIFSQDVLLEDNQIYHCWHQAVGTKKVGVGTTIRRNFIHDAQVGVNCENSSMPTIVDNKLVAAPIGEECGNGSNNEIIEQPADTTGGTYAGQLIYPSNKP